MEILITSKTHKGRSACVGGLVLNTNRMVRLLNPGNWDQYADTNFNIGDIWDIQFRNCENVEVPHVEDIIISSKRFVRRVDDISSYIIHCGVTIYRGSPSRIFDGCLRWTVNGSGFLENRDHLPPNSVGFWISDQELVLDTDNKHFIYHPQDKSQNKKLPYVGFAPLVQRIPSGTLMRVSLARWWKPADSDIAERCYLQLSGWYGL